MVYPVCSFLSPGTGLLLLFFPLCAARGGRKKVGGDIPPPPLHHTTHIKATYKGEYSIAGGGNNCPPSFSHICSRWKEAYREGRIV